ncbi:MAG TPA: hypothetical protein VGK49_12280 [Ilumatobacteraceae bacterium]
MTDHPPQSQAEALDEDKISDVADFSGDEYGDGLPGYPPDRPLGDRFGVTAFEEDAGESFAERTLREEPEDLGEDAAVMVARDEVGQLVATHEMGDDREEQAIADEVGGEETGPEAAAVRVEDEPS